MGMIFDDVSVEELEHFDDQEELQQLPEEELSLFFGKENNNKCNLLKEYNIEERGFLLSYGEGNGTIPIGVFVVVGYIDYEGNQVPESVVDKIGGTIVFKEIDIDDSDKVYIKTDGGQIIMPYMVYKLSSRRAKHNNREFLQLSNDENVNAKSINEISEVFKDLLAEQNNDSELRYLNLYGDYLYECRADYINSNGDNMGYNYTLYPFELKPNKEIFNNIFHEQKKQKSIDKR